MNELFNSSDGLIAINLRSLVRGDIDKYEYRNRHGEIYTFSMLSENILEMKGVFDYIRVSYEEDRPHRMIMLDPAGGPFLNRDMIIDENTNTKIDFFERKDAIKYLIHLK